MGERGVSGSSRNSSAPVPPSVEATMLPQVPSRSCRTARATARRIASVLTLALAAACSSEPTSPDTRPTEPADLSRTAFLLTIDVASGRVTVGRPQQASRSSAGPAASPVSTATTPRSPA